MNREEFLRQYVVDPRAFEGSAQETKERCDAAIPGIIRDRLKGMTYQQTAENNGVSTSFAYKIIKENFAL